MIITSKINMDLALRGAPPVVHAVQDDKYSRNLEIQLLDNGVAWVVPAGAGAVVRYNKPDGTGGEYDTLPDGTAAVVVDSSRLTVALAPQVLSCAGTAILAVGLISGDAEINTFSMKICVEANPERRIASEDYYKLTGCVPRAGWEAGKVLGTDEKGNVVAMEAPEGGADVTVEEVLAALPVVTEIDLTNFPNSGFTEVVDGETIEHTSSYDESTGIMTIDGVTIKFPVATEAAE